jgi:Fe2+ or Zn2+ uptake regulation protein
MEFRREIVSAEEIYQRVSSVMPDISRMTVYNTLCEMVALDALVEVEVLRGDRYQSRVRGAGALVG